MHREANDARGPRGVTPRRAVLVATILATAVIACDDATGRAGGTLCLACGLVADAEAEVIRRDRELRASCGECPAGMGCNTLYEPPRCALDPGGEDDRCGFQLNTGFYCGRGLACEEGVCRSLPAVGEPCDFDADEHVTLSHLHPTYCGPGLVCGTDERCHAGCSGDCTTPQLCNPLVDPPACTSDIGLVGDPCGRVHSLWSFDCMLLHVCVDRGSGGRCELTGDGATCGDERCPSGFTCDATRRVCVAAAP